jgi:hypothetical protein
MTSKLTPGQRLFAIVEQGLCIGCGLCQSVAGEDRVRVTKTSSGYLHPVIDMTRSTGFTRFAPEPGSKACRSGWSNPIRDTTMSGGRGVVWFAPGPATPKYASKGRPVAC